MKIITNIILNNYEWYHKKILEEELEFNDDCDLLLQCPSVG